MPLTGWSASAHHHHHHHHHHHPAGADGKSSSHAANHAGSSSTASEAASNASMRRQAQPDHVRLSPHMLFRKVSSAGTHDCHHHFLTAERIHTSPTGGSNGSSSGPGSSPAFAEAAPAGLQLPSFICKHCCTHLRLTRTEQMQQQQDHHNHHVQHRLQQHSSSSSSLSLSQSTTSMPTAASPPMALCTHPRLHLYETCIIEEISPPRTAVWAACRHCSLAWDMVLTPPLVSDSRLMMLLQNLELSRQATVLFMLVFYIDNILEGSSKPINTLNAKFAEFIGINDTTVGLLADMGYVLNGTHFTPPDPSAIKHQALRKMSEEISLRKFLLQAGGGPTKNQMYTFSEATDTLCALIGLRYVGQDASLFLAEMWKRIRLQHPSYTLLGSTADLSDLQIRDMYSGLSALEPAMQPKYLDALIEITTLRKSPLLEDFIAMERSKGVMSDSEITEAYRILGVDDSHHATATQLIETFTSAYTANPHRLGEFRQALKAIQMHRSCTIIEHFLNTGEMVTQSNSVTAMDVDSNNLPAGLNNIGNTCYLNSLLQFYFSLQNLREEVLAFQPKATSPSSTSSDREQQASEFLVYLRRLFASLIWTDQYSVTPEKRLAEITLTGEYGSATFGQQQDIHECMDKILDMMESVFRKRDPSCQTHCSILQDLFFGTTRQTLRYEDQTGKRHVREKDEPFHQLIVDAAEDLYAAMDAFFDAQQVEFEGTSAIRDLSIVKFPPILTIQINRVKFDRTTSRVYKSNSFVRFEKTIFLERYSAEKLDVVRERRQHMSRLTSEYGMLREQLVSKTDSNRYPAPPLLLLESTIRILHAHADHVKDATLAPALGKVSEDLQRQISDLQSRIEPLKREMKLVYNDMRGDEYRLYAVFVHEGEASYGHYWIFLHDQDYQQPQQHNHQTPQSNQESSGRWIMYNDSIVKEVSEAEVFADTTGSSANAYALVYVRSADFASLVRPYARDGKHRQDYEARFPGLRPTTVSPAASVPKVAESHHGSTASSHTFHAGSSGIGPASVPDSTTDRDLADAEPMADVQQDEQQQRYKRNSNASMTMSISDLMHDDDDQLPDHSDRMDPLPSADVPGSRSGSMSGSGSVSGSAMGSSAATISGTSPNSNGGHDGTAKSRPSISMSEVESTTGVMMVE
ncbi:hypothetical protein BC831DRAFT_75405 [Entophlyctis helioformis]|nr:hypothetical protein BC831DRAFT_75405 [Entophlyctis helioformis]